MKAATTGKFILEQWLHDSIRWAAGEDPGLDQYLGQESLGQINRDRIEKYHLFKARRALSYASEKSPYYKELFRKNGISPDDIRSLSDFASIPFTDPADLAKNPHRFLCVSLGDITRPVNFISSGTTGPQKSVYFTDRDIENIVEFMEMGMRTVAGSEDVVQIILHGGTSFGQLDLLARGVERIGALAIKAGVLLTPEEQLELIKEHRSTVIFGRVSRIYRITQELLARGHDLGSLGVKTIFLTSEYLPEPMKKRLESIWNCEVSFHYGLTEMGLGVAVECPAHHGFHFNEVDLLLEIVDPKTGEVIKDDRKGELVFTTLNREGMPLIRYRTHDISRLITESCPCGAATLLKFDCTPHRLESIVRIGDGDEIYPSLFEDVLYRMPEVIDYQADLKRIGGRDILSFLVEVTEAGNGIAESLAKELSSLPVIRENVSRGRMAGPEVKLAGIGGLQSRGRAKKMILDHRGMCDHE